MNGIPMGLCHDFAVMKFVGTAGESFRAGLFDVRQPAYTGRNRCLPCTVINIFIALLIGVVLWFVSPELAFVTVLGMLGVIYVRGYLIPGTPTLTKRYFPAWVHSAFGYPSIPTTETGFDPEAYLLETGVVLEDDDGLDLHLEPGFESRWVARYRELNRTGEDRSLLAGVVGVDEDRLEIVSRGDGFVGWADGRWIGQWESRVAFIADVAANDLLAGSVQTWESLPLATQSNALGVLRLFIERCPACDGVVTLDDAVRTSCCSEVDVIASTCDGCGERLFEAVFDPASLEATEAEPNGSTPV